MPFSESDLDNLLESFDAKDVTVKLSGATVKTIKGAWRRATETYSPGDSEQMRIRPSILCKASDLEGIDRSHTFTVDGVAYKALGDFIPQNSGLSRVILVKA